MTNSKSNLEKFEDVRFNLSVATVVVLIIVAILRTDSNLSPLSTPVTCPRDFFDPYCGVTLTTDSSRAIKIVSNWSANQRSNSESSQKLVNHMFQAIGSIYHFNCFIIYRITYSTPCFWNITRFQGRSHSISH